MTGFTFYCRVCRHIFWAATCLLFLPMSFSWASCSPVDTPMPKNSIIVLPPELTVDRDAPVGTLLWDSGWSETGEIALSCDMNSKRKLGYTKTLSLSSSGNPGVYNSGVPGVGIKVLHYFAQDTVGDEIVQSPPVEYAHGDIKAESKGKYKVQLIVTGPVKSGITRFSSPLAYQEINGLVTDTLTLTNTSTRVNTVGCQLNDTAIFVDLGDHDQHEFHRGVGYTTSPQAFSIALLCDEGTKVDIKIEAQTAESGETGIMALDEDNNSAKGLGIQLLRGDGTTPFVLNKQVYLTEARNNKEIRIPFKARYYQISRSVTEGNANATATFTMTYR